MGGKGTEGSYLVYMLKEIFLSPWLSAPATNTQRTVILLPPEQVFIIVLFQLEAVVGE